ncbi:50S ribosomal protein L11 [Candidatus Cyrtobacter comes]|uniref:Large ribosomal subunit protein uL11 n=1 Tax=Candidatus Cyrtobacter comes TaxID=675776 RepID=A0ABU5L705_9RICK|nr:50S ribosomal protein L11 [Candidatus Cyrtobacter comes]MDZ5761827.1 50S ribosomal protein L11 [Candidatus Cyrtobacter comes]
MKKRNEASVVKLQIPARQANPAPPIGSALGPKGINIVEFCKRFNEQTKDEEVGTPIPVEISINRDRSFSFIMKLPPVSYMLKKAANITKGSKEVGKGLFVGSVTMDSIIEIAKKKMGDMLVDRLDSAIKMVIGTATSMGIRVLGNEGE